MSQELQPNDREAMQQKIERLQGLLSATNDAYVRTEKKLAKLRGEHEELKATTELVRGGARLWKEQVEHLQKRVDHLQSIFGDRAIKLRDLRIAILAFEPFDECAFSSRGGECVICEAEEYLGELHEDDCPVPKLRKALEDSKQ